MSDCGLRVRRSAQSGPIRSTVVAIACFVRGLPLFFSASPATPLRVLGIIALDTLHVLRHAQPLSHKRRKELAAFLDFQGCANASFDHKHVDDDASRSLRERLDEFGLGPCVERYLARLRELEHRRPPIEGEQRRFDQARSYREAVAHLAIAATAAIALRGDCGDEDIRPSCVDADIDALYRILMQCQIIDDVLDYPEDLAGGLPSFLTGSASLPHATGSTAVAARSYAAGPDGAPGDAVLPLRLTLRVITAATTLVIGIADTFVHIKGVKIGS